MVVDGEQRWQAVGAVMGAVLVVAHVYREDETDDEEIIRIISARQASKLERAFYYQQTA